MASIKIDSDLRPIGSELFLDSESYLEELSANDQINKIVGGTFITRWNIVPSWDYTTPGVPALVRPARPGLPRSR